MVLEKNLISFFTLLTVNTALRNGLVKSDGDLNLGEWRHPKEGGLPITATLGSPIILASGEISHEYAIPFNALINLTEAEDNFLLIFLIPYLLEVIINRT